MRAPGQPGTRLGLLLSLGLGALYAGFIAAVAFYPSFLARPVFAGGTVTLWFAYAFGLIWAAVLATGFYVLRVNALEDRALEERP